MPELTHLTWLEARIGGIYTLLEMTQVKTIVLDVGDGAR